MVNRQSAIGNRNRLLHNIHNIGDENKKQAEAQNINDSKKSPEAA
jgi:hypothetical protein